MKFLLMPYLLWSVIGIAYAYILIHLSEFRGVNFNFGDIRWWGHAMGIGGAPQFMFHLWFVRTIMILTIVSPVIGWLLVRCGWLLIVVVMIAAMFGDYGVAYFKMGDLVFFLIGARVSLGGESCDGWACVRGKAVRNTLPMLCWAVLVVLKVWLTHYGLSGYDGVIRFHAFKINLLLVCNLFGLIAMWLLSELLVDKIPTWFDCVMRISFFLYCLHWLILIGINILMKHLGVVGLLSYMLRPMLVIVTCAICFWGLKKVSPHLLHILSGGRV